MDNKHKLFEPFKKIIERHGERVLINTPYCLQHRKRYGSCEGCEAEVGCQIADQMMDLVARECSNNGTPIEVAASMIVCRYIGDES